VSHLPDEVLARRATAGHRECFEELLARHRNRVYRLCYHLAGNAEDAEDWAQECFVRVYRQLGHYHPEMAFTPWLLRVSANTCINLAKARARRQERFLLGLNEGTMGETSRGAAPAPGDPLRAVLGAEEAQSVHAAIEALPPALRQAVVLRVVEDLSFRELAEVLGVPLPTAATRVRRALLQVRECLVKAGITVEQSQR